MKEFFSIKREQAGVFFVAVILMIFGFNAMYMGDDRFAVMALMAAYFALRCVQYSRVITDVTIIINESVMIARDTSLLVEQTRAVIKEFKCDEKDGETCEKIKTEVLQ